MSQHAGCLHCAWEQWRSCQASRKVPLGPTLAVAFLTHRAQTQSPVSGGQRYPASLKKHVFIFSVCICCSTGQNWLLDSPRGKTGFVMIFFSLFIFIYSVYILITAPPATHSPTLINPSPITLSLPPQRMGDIPWILTLLGISSCSRTRYISY